MENPLFKERQDKIKKISDLGFKPYPERFERTHFSDEALKLGEKKIREVELIVKKNKNKMTLAGKGKKGTLTLAWEKVTASVPIVVK